MVYPSGALCSREICASLLLPYFQVPEEKKTRIEQNPFQAKSAFPHKGSALGGAWMSSEDFAVVVDFMHKTVTTYSNEAL